MKVLLTATVQSHICQFHKALAEVLHEHDCEIHVAAKDNLAEKNGIQLDFVDKVYNVPFSRSPKSLSNIKAYKELKKIIDEGEYDVIHCNTPVAGILTRYAARKVRKNGTKVIYTAHGFHFFKGASQQNWLFYYPVEKFFADNFTDILITINEEDYKLASRKYRCVVEHIHGVGVDENRYTLVSKEEKEKLKEQMGYDKDQKIILCVGELLPNKNQKMAINMMQELIKTYPNAKLLIAGNGKEKENLENQIKELNLGDNVEMLGYCTHLQDYQHIADFMVSCSKREGLGLNIIEAMLSGTPVVATNNRGHREIICNENYGAIVDIDDYKGMSEKIKNTFQNEEKYNLIVTKAFERVKDYCFKAVEKELNKIYF